VSCGVVAASLGDGGACVVTADDGDGTCCGCTEGCTVGPEVTELLRRRSCSRYSTIRKTKSLAINTIE
jgi:hypothetical protein